jgi:hypothetical protein
MAGRGERPPDPAREHPVNQAIQNISRQSWGVLFNLLNTPGMPREAIEMKKTALVGEIRGVIAQIEAL